MHQLQKTEFSKLKEIVICHQKCFPRSLSSKLGSSYLIKSFEWFLVAENRFLSHIIENDVIVGYYGGFLPKFPGDGSTSGMMQYAMKEAIYGIIKHPFLIVNKEVISF